MVEETAKTTEKEERLTQHRRPTPFALRPEPGSGTSLFYIFHHWRSTLKSPQTRR
jgi:hypothetical protein